MTSIVWYDRHSLVNQDISCPHNIHWMTGTQYSTQRYQNKFYATDCLYIWYSGTVVACSACHCFCEWETSDCLKTEILFRRVFLLCDTIVECLVYFYYVSNTPPTIAPEKPGEMVHPGINFPGRHYFVENICSTNRACFHFRQILKKKWSFFITTIP